MCRGLFMGRFCQLGMWVVESNCLVKKCSCILWPPQFSSLIQLVYDKMCAKKFGRQMIGWIIIRQCGCGRPHFIIMRSNKSNTLWCPKLQTGSTFFVHITIDPSFFSKKTPPVIHTVCSCYKPRHYWGLHSFLNFGEISLKLFFVVVYFVVNSS